MSYTTKVVNGAKKLRKNGFSLQQIANTYKISKSTASLWTSKVTISEAGNRKIKSRQDDARQKAFLTIANSRKEIRDKIIISAKKTIDKIKLTPELSKLLVAIFLWTEGEKGNFTRVGFTNSDPLMITTFLYLIRNSFQLNESKFRGLVHIHEYHNEKQIIKFWSGITKIPATQFTKSYLKAHTGKRIRANYMGSIHINYYDFRVAREIASVYNMFASKLRGVG